MSQLPLLSQHPTISFRNPSKSANKKLISLTPLIDVVFILLIFFMLASNFIEWASIQVSVAPVSEMRAFDEKQNMVVVVGEKEVWFNEENIAFTQISEHVLAHLQTYPAAILHIQPKAQVSIQHLVDVIDSLQQSGISTYTLVADPDWQGE